MRDFTQTRAVLFDKDGTLFDFDATWAKVTHDVIAELADGDAARAEMLGEKVGFDVASRRFRPGAPVVAGSVGEVAATWAALTPETTSQEMERWLIQAAGRLSRGSAVAASADLAGLLARLRSGGLALGVATNDTEAAARAQLIEAGVLDAFDFIAGYDSGFGAKPDPGMVLAFAEAVGASVAEVAMIGDSRHDMETAARAGGAARIAVLTGPAGPADLEPVSDIVVANIDALPALFAV